MGNEWGDFGDTHLPWVTFVVVDDELAHPIEVSFFGAGGVLFDSQGFAILVKEFFVLG